MFVVAGALSRTAGSCSCQARIHLARQVLHSRDLCCLVARCTPAVSREPLQARQHQFCQVRSDATQVVQIPAERLDQLLEAEITALSLKPHRELTLQSMLRLIDSSEEGVRELLHDELPIRYAHRVKMLESLPDWRAKKSIGVIRDMYVTSFKELRRAEPSDAETFEEMIRNIKYRHGKTNRLVGAFRQYTDEKAMSEAETNEWLYRFFLLRASTNMLISQYLEMSPRGKESAASRRFRPYQSSVNTSCDPFQISEFAAGVVEKMCFDRYGVAPKIHVTDCGSQAQPLVPRFLFYIVSELLKNSVRATVERHHKGGSIPSELPPIEILVSGDDNVSGIRISDKGGGIPVEALGHIWSYLYTTAECLTVTGSRLGVDAPSEQSQMDSLEQEVIIGSPLAGIGCGLPLSRLYAEFLGGRVELQSLPRYGSDAFIYVHSQGVQPVSGTAPSVASSHLNLRI